MAKQIIDRVNVSNTEYNVASSAYATCATTAATVAKVAYFQGDSTSATGFVPSTGVTVHVKFTYANTAANPTLSINGSTAAKIMKYGTTAVGKTVYTSWQAGAIVSLTYDGTNWLLNDHKNETTGTGDITGVTAGNGLTGGATSGTATLNVGEGDGISVTADAVAAKAGSGITVNSSGINVNTGYTTSGKNYKVQVDSTSGGLYVNVPWTDTDTNTHNSHAIISGTKSDGSTQIKGSASSGDITLGDSGVTAGTYKRVTVNSKGIVVGGDNTDADTNTWRKVQLDGTDKLGTGTNTNPLNIKAGSNMTITESNGTFTFVATDTKYTHPTYTSKTSGLYKITVDGTGHVSAATAVAKADITGLGIPGSDTNTDRSSLAYCSTTAGTAAKTATMPGFALSSGQYIFLRTTVPNSATSNVTLNVNSTGAKPVKIGNSSTNPTASNFPAGDYLANYDGTNWILTRIYLTDTNTNTTFSGIAYCTTAAGTTAKTATMPGFALVFGQRILLRTTVSNTATGNVQLNVNSTGAFPIGIAGADVTASNFPAGDYIAEYKGSSWDLTRIYLTDTNTTYSLVGANGTTGLVKNGSSVTSTSGLTACPIISGVPYYKDTNTQADYGNITTSGTITSTAVTSATGVLVYDSSNKIQRATAANARAIIGAGTSNLTLAGNGSATTAAKSDHSHYAIVSPYSYLNLANNDESSYIELNEDMISIYGSNGVELGATNGYASIDIGSCDITLAGVSRLGTGKPNIADTFDYGTPGQVLSVGDDGYVCWTDAPSGGGDFETEEFSIAILDEQGGQQSELIAGQYYSLAAGGARFNFKTPEGCRYEYVAPDSSNTHLNYPLLCKGSLSTQEEACKPKFTSEVTLNPYTGLLVATQVQATSFQATSDRRLKENIKPYSPTKSILDLPIVEFDYKKNKLHSIGCIAQDLQEICPEIVNEDAEGYLSINESKIVYLLLNEVKKLKAEVEALKQVK